MDIDFSLVLVSLIAICGALWLVDIAAFRKPRLALIAEFRRGKGANLTPDELDKSIQELAREPLLIEYAKSFFPVLLIVLVLRSFLIEPFQIPTGSMIPTLKVGDFILVNKYAYGVRLPVIGTKILDVGDPQRGEVMVFFPPHEPKYYVKRVVGLPGDTVRYENKTLYINGEEVPKQYLEDIQIDVVIGGVPTQLGGSLYRETLGGVEHDTQFIDAAGARSSRTSWVIPNGHYFMMGDNRDNSLDSREWGVVPESEIVGKAIAVWMHKEPGLNLPTFSQNRTIR